MLKLTKPIAMLITLNFVNKVRKLNNQNFLHTLFKCISRSSILFRYFLLRKQKNNDLFMILNFSGFSFCISVLVQNNQGLSAK